MTDKLDVEAIKEPREAAEYFCCVAGKDEQIEPLAAAFEARDNYWRATLAAKEAALDLYKIKAGKQEAEILKLSGEIGGLHAQVEAAESRAAALEKERDELPRVHPTLCDNRIICLQRELNAANEKNAAIQAQLAQAKAEAFEEAAKLRCVDCREGFPTVRGKDDRLIHVHDAKTGDSWGCTAQDIMDQAAALRQSVPASPAKEKP